jgi:hypothetical protein
MPWFQAKGHITHNDVAYPKGVVVEFPAGAVISDLFVPCDAPAHAKVVAPVVVEAPASVVVEPETVAYEKPSHGKRK